MAPYDKVSKHLKGKFTHFQKFVIGKSSWNYEKEKKKILTVEGFYCDVISGKKVVCLYKPYINVKNQKALISYQTYQIW